jgi:ectoine hydroxylase-related dioxygenase (phytanoyl-CoA dioxygenase family)
MPGHTSADGTAASALSPAQVAAWNRDGYLVLDRFIDGELLAALRDAYDEVLSGAVEASGDRMLGEITRQVMNPSDAHPLFEDNPAVRAGLAIASQLLGKDGVARSFDMLIYKPPGHPHPTPWHQDMAYTARPFATAGMPILLATVQFWLPLDDVDEENGCMRFIPGRHTGPLLEHHVASGDPEDEGRLLALPHPEEQLDLTAAVTAAIPAGGVTMHSFGTPHYTGANRSADRPRRAYIFNIADPAPFAALHS